MQHSTEGTVCVPALCVKHQRVVIDRLRIPKHGPWNAALMIVNLLLFGRVIADDRITERIGDAEGVEFASTASLVLAEIGCLACFQGDAVYQAIKLIKRKGLKHAADVSRGEIAHPFWHPKRPE